MAYINLASSQSVHNRYIGANGFKGVDFSSAPAFVALDRFSDAKNVYKDYKNGLGACVETFPGYRSIYHFVNGVDNIYKTEKVFHFKFSSGKEYLFAWFDDGASVWSFLKNGNEGYKSIADIDGAPVNVVTFYDDALYIFASGFCARITEEFINKLIDLINRGESANNTAFEIAESYIPTTFRDGEPYEQKNMLTREFVETFTVGTVELNKDICIYTLSWKNETGIPDPKLPARYWYKTSEGGDKQFFLTSSKGIKKGSARADAKSKTAYFYIDKDVSVTKVGVTFQVKVKKEDEDVYEYGYTEVANDTSNTTPETASSQVSVTFYPRERVKAYTSIIFDGVEYVNYEEKTVKMTISKTLDGFVESITFTQSNSSGEQIDNPLITVGMQLILCGSADHDVSNEKNPTFGDAHPEYKGSYSGAICGCTMIAYFDGRIFLAGNPSLPNVVFYSSRMLNGANSITYFGNLNYVSVGESTYPIKALVSAADKLVVLKDGDSAEPSMFYLTGIDTGENLIPRIYAVTSGIPSVGCVGAACNFLDDIVFTSKIGIVGINKQAINLERSVGNRSSLINGRLLLEDMTQAVMAEWQGYLCVLFKNNGHLYLADSRQTSSGEYEWYYIDSLGSWKGDYPKYTYLDENGDEVVLTKEQADLVKCHDGIYYIDSDESDSYGSGEIVVEPDGSMIGGEFYPATSIFSNGDLLFFGAGEGKIMIVNTDKRGVPSKEEETDKEGETVLFNAEAYKAECGNLIRPEWYSFAGHAYESFVQTAYDDGGIPHLAKSTVSRSTVGDMKPMPGSRFFFKVYTADANWQDLGASGNVIPDFSLWSFDTVSFQQDVHTISTVNERTRKWSRKMYRIYSGGFCQPFGIYKISYRYVVAGRIRQ